MKDDKNDKWINIGLISIGIFSIIMLILRILGIISIFMFKSFNI